MRTLLILPALLLACVAGAADPPPLVYVPYEDLETIDPAGRSVWLRYDRFLELWRGLDPATALPPVPAALDEVVFTGRVAGEVAELRVTGSATVLAERWATIALPADLALTAFTAEDPRVVLERGPDGLRLHLPERGRYPFTATLVAPVARDLAGRSLAISIPAAGAARLDLVLPDDDAQVSAMPPVALTTGPAPGGGTRVTAVLGGAAGVALTWQPQVVDVAGPPLVVVEQHARAVAGERSLRLDVALDVRILRRPLAELSLTLPEGFQPLAVEADGLAGWEIVGGTLRLRPEEEVADRWAIAVRLERLLPELAEGASRPLDVPLPAVVDAARTTGTLALVAGDGMAVALERGDGLAQIDPAELPPAVAAGAVAAWRFHAPPPPARALVTRLAPEVRSELHQLVRLGTDEDTSHVALALDVRKAGVFALVVELPARWELVDVGGLALDDQRAEAAGEGRRRWRLGLRGRLLGTAEATLRLRAPGSIPRGGGQAARIDLAPPRLVGARRQTATVAIAAPSGWALASVDRTGLAPVEAEPLRRSGALMAAARELREDEELALAFSGIDAGAAELVLSADQRSRELTATHEELLTLADGQWRRTVSWRGRVRYAGAPTLRVRAPTALDERIAFKHPALAERVAVERDAGTTTWELRFQNPLIGAFTLVAEASGDLPPLAAGSPTPFSAEPISLAEPARMRVVQAVARSAIEVAATADGLADLGASDVPASLQTEGLVAGFHGAQPARIAATLVRHDLVALADAHVEASRWAAVVGADGRARIKGRIELTDRGRPYLELRLPEGAELLEVAVAGRQARPSRRADGAVLIRLDDAQARQAVALVYEQRVADGLGRGGRLALDLPRIDGAGAVPVERTELTLWLPDELAAVALGGDLRRADGVSAPLEGDGLATRFTPFGRALPLRRLGDGGAVRLGYLDATWLRAVVLAAGVLAAAAALALRRRAAPLAALAVATVLAALVVEGPLRAVAGAAALGALAGGCAALAWRAVAAWREARRRSGFGALSPVADPWLEGAAPAGGQPPTPPSPPPTPPTGGAP